MEKAFEPNNVHDRGTWKRLSCTERMTSSSEVCYWLDSRSDRYQVVVIWIYVDR